MKWLSGADDIGYDEVMNTQWGLGNMNENGERFAGPCSLDQLVIGGNIFPRKQFHNGTLRSPDHVTENQIDHICINISSMGRCQGDKRSNISSDHYLLITAARLRLKKYNNTTNTRSRYNVNALKTGSEEIIPPQPGQKDSSRHKTS